MALTVVDLTAFESELPEEAEEMNAPEQYARDDEDAPLVSQNAPFPRKSDFYNYISTIFTSENKKTHGIEHNACGLFYIVN